MLSPFNTIFTHSETVTKRSLVSASRIYSVIATF